MPTSTTIALAWCLAWGESRDPAHAPASLQQMVRALRSGDKAGIPSELGAILRQIQQFQQSSNHFPKTLQALQALYPDVWQQQSRIGLVYGGATKIKGYVFESAKLAEIRGASALLDRINLVDLPAFFGDPTDTYSGWQDLDEGSRARLREFVEDPDPRAGIQAWLQEHYPGLAAALIPELIIYSTGGNILAFCPAAWVNDLADAIERRYTQETLTANACAVGSTFRLLEFRYGLLRDPIEQTPWLDWLEANKDHSLVKAYFGACQEEDFQNRKSFNELVGNLAAQFNYRRNGNPDPERVSRAYPAFFETHPYVRRDSTDRRLAIAKAELPGDPWLSEATARKALVGCQAKRIETGKQGWYRKFPEWDPGFVESWVTRFGRFLDSEAGEPYRERYWQDYESKARPQDRIGEAQSLREVANASNGCQGFVAYIYADGNNMGGYIQKIKTPEQYQQFSRDVSEATEKAVYHALAQHLQAHQIQGLQQDPDSYQNRNGQWIHPFEILTIGGDDVFMVVPAHKALDIAATICEQFERILLAKSQDPEQSLNYAAQTPGIIPQRYQTRDSQGSSGQLCQLSSSVGVLIASEDTPIYYAQKLAEQLLKSAKTYSKKLKLKDKDYSVATLDFLALKSVTMIASNIKDFRKEALEIPKDNHTLKLYASPYTVPEINGLLKTLHALKESGFPRSQLYQMRSFLEKGKRTATLNYLYFRTRLKEKAKPLMEEFEQTWCKAKTNDGHLPPWMHIPANANGSKNSTYETIWRDLVDLYAFVSEPVQNKAPTAREE
ncbi:MAG: type III-B CRISPR-associated protein Cas10/Cmr2 [Thermostichus sp. DRC_bins_24]